MQLQYKLQKSEEITCLEKNKQETRHRLKYFGISKKEKKYGLIFWTPSDKQDKQRNKAPLVCLECNLQQKKYGWCISNWKFQETEARTYLETRKQERRYRWCFSMLK